MKKRLTCILCPNGCKLTVQLEGTEILTLDGARCPRGREFVEQELHDPHRNIATSVLVRGGELPLASVRLTGPIPKHQIFRVMEEVKKIQLEAPVVSGQVLLSDVLGLGVDVICTKHVGEALR